MTKKRRRLIAASCFSLALWAAGADANDSGVRVFPPSYFDAFDPETALDLAQNTPGFQLQAAGGGRSLSGARPGLDMQLSQSIFT